MVKLFAPSEKTLMSIISLEENDDFKEVMTYLKANDIFLAQFACQIPDERTSTRYQGGSAGLHCFVDQVKEARKALEKLRAKEAKKQK